MIVALGKNDQGAGWDRLTWPQDQSSETVEGPEQLLSDSAPRETSGSMNLAHVDHWHRGGTGEGRRELFFLYGKGLLNK